MAAVVTEARKNGARIPWSYWRDRPLTVEQYLAEPTLADPICRLDCDIPVDGVADVRAHVGRAGAGSAATGRCTSPVSRVARAAARRLPLHWPLDDIIDGGADTVRGCGGRPDLTIERRRPATGLRRLLAVRVVLARGARRLPGRRGAPLRRLRRHRQRPPRTLFPHCRVGVHSATAACTACRRCSSATCSCRGGRATVSATCRWVSRASRRRTSVVSLPTPSEPI